MSFKVHASNLHRIMKCAGVIKFTDLPPYKESEAAMEGTAAGEVLALLINNDTERGLTHASNGVLFDQEMVDHAVRLAQLLPQGPGHTEQDATWISDRGVTVSGRSDVAWQNGETMHVVDYKYGYSIVESFENWQLLSYAIGETVKRGKLFDHYELSILQPRAYHEAGEFRTWRITGLELIQYKEQIEKRLNAMLEGEESLVTGPHCKYCKVAEAGRCGAFNQAAINMVEVITEKQIDMRMTNDQIAKEYELFSRMSDLLKIKLDSLSEQLKEKLQAGEAVGDYQLAPTGGRRVWKSGLTADSIAAFTGLDRNTLTELISPAKFEKAIGKQPDLLNNFTVKVGGGFKITKGKSTKQLATVFAGIKGE